MAVHVEDELLIGFLQDQANRLRIDSVRSTTAAGSGHPTSSASAAEIVAVLFFSVMRYDPHDPGNRSNDLFILSKGHAAPVLYAAWAEAGYLPQQELLKLRKIDSDLEGHPTPRLPFVSIATGSLGQGLSAGVGMALNARRLEKSEQRIYVLLGDGESSEGAVWEAAEIASQYGLGNLCATIDVNRLGQSEPTMWQHDLARHAARWGGFGWRVLQVDGHDISALLHAYRDAAESADTPTVVLAKTIKGKGIPIAEGKEGYHGKALSAPEAERTIEFLQKQLSNAHFEWKPKSLARTVPRSSAKPLNTLPAPPYVPGSAQVATRKAFGEALAKLGKLNSQIVVLDGDVKNSTHTQDFQRECPERFFQMYIAEQNMIGAATGFAAQGKIPFAATFACFLTRAYDFIRMAAISGSNIKLVGSHCGVSIGEDGPSQMGLEDLAMMCAEPNLTVLYPCDGVSAWRATELVAETTGPAYIRTTRPKTSVLYPSDERFEIGKCKVLRASTNDQVTVIAAGITVFEALAAFEQLAQTGTAIRVIDLFSVRPIDVRTLQQAADATKGRIVTVEDHYAHGGVGDVVLSALADRRITLRKLAIREIPRSGRAQELLDRYGISARHVVDAVRSLLEQDRGLQRTA